MYKMLFLGMNYVYKACNPTILNLTIDKEKISLGLLDYRPKLFISVKQCHPLHTLHIPLR